MMNKEKFDSPDHAAQAFIAGAIEVEVNSTNHKVCLGPSNNGWFTLYWSATAKSKWDWIGLYSNTSKADSDYIGGNNWQWANDEGKYVTSTACQPGYEARYLVWDTSSKSYKSVARTGAYPERVCS